MNIEVYTDPHSLYALAAEWSRLAGMHHRNRIFATPQWAQTWWQSFGAGRDLCLITARENGRLVGLVPLFVEQEEGRPVARFLGGVDVTDYEDVVTLPGREQDVWRQALAFLDEQPWDLDLHNIPGDSPTVAFFRGLAAEGSHSVLIEVEDVCPVLRPLPPDFETYLGSLDKKDRHELRRKLRRLMGDPDLETAITWQQDDIKTAMADFVHLHKLSSPDKSEFMTPRMVGFFTDLAQMCQEHGWLCLAFLTVQGKPVSTIMAFEYGDWFGLYNSGYDPAYEYLSVGLLLKALAIEHAIQTGKTCYDFLQGSERYKYDLGGKDTYVYHICCRRS